MDIIGVLLAISLAISYLIRQSERDKQQRAHAVAEWVNNAEFKSEKELLENRPLHSASFTSDMDQGRV